MITTVFMLCISQTSTTSISLLLDEQRQKIESLELQVEELNARKITIPSLSLMDDVKLRFGAYLDVGFFDARGDGVAYARDPGKELHPELAMFPWVFTGDPWSNTINAQGDSADLGLDRTNLDRSDPIGSAGKPSFIVNTVNLSLLASLRNDAFVEVSLNFEPRQGVLGSSGDPLDVDLAYLEYRPLEGTDLSLFAGKFESTFGREYRTRKAPDRFGVTPSLIARYTSGTQLGLKVRGSVLDGMFTYNLAFTNGGPSTEKFSHFFNEIDSNDFKTVSGRVSVLERFGEDTPLDIEIGTSGVIGAQDLQNRDDVLHWQAGVDLKMVYADLRLEAELLRSFANREKTTNGSWLRATGGYAELSYQALAWLGVLARADFRDADLFADPNVYVTNTVRGTAGFRFDITWNAIAKVEYTHVRELEGPELNDDVITTALIIRM
jgi:hypothetical protein